MSELEKAPTVGAFTEILASTRVPTAFFDALEGVVVTEVICDGCRTNVGTPRYWDSPQGPAGGHFCDRCERTLARLKSYLTAASALRFKARTAPEGEWQKALDAADDWDERAAAELKAVAA